jgi:hypothetical protein
MVSRTCGADRKNRSAGVWPPRDVCVRLKLYQSTYSFTRRMQSSKSTKTVFERNSSQSVFHHRSSLPTVIGC